MSTRTRRRVDASGKVIAVTASETGNAVVEALACSTPVLISNKVNIWREITMNDAGFADEDDLSGTIRLLERWIATPGAERNWMRAKARRCFETRFEINRAVDSLLRVLREHRAAA